MGAETSFGAARRHAAEGTQDAGGAEDAHSHRPGERGRQTVQDQRGVIEEVGGEAVHLAFGFDCGSEPVGECDGGYSPIRFLEHGEEDGCRGTAVFVADADSWTA